MKNLGRLWPVLLILISLGVAVYFISVTTTRTLTGLESVLLQIFALATGLAGSFIFGQQSARKAATEIIKPHARSAFRRLLSLYRSLSRVANILASSQDFESREDYEVMQAKLEGIVVEQLTTAGDALEDWRDIVPEDVEELYQRLSPDNVTRV